MPSVVGTSTSGTATDHSLQRKSFYANGRFWVFYSDGTNMVYRTSTDGSTWTAATTVKTNVYYGYTFSVWFDGTYLHYAYASSSSIYYRRGTPNSDGTITWSAVEQTVSTTYNTADYPVVSVDSNGYVWIGYKDYTGTYVYPYVIKSGNNDGTWGTTPAGFPYQLSTIDNTYWMVSIIPLTAGKMLAVYVYEKVTVKARRWTGSAWDTEVATTKLIEIGEYFSAVAQGDDVHLTFLERINYNILYTKYVYSTNSFTAETTLATGNMYTPPVISIDPVLNDLYLFWPNANNHIYYRKYNAGTDTWETAVDWINESTDVLTGNDPVQTTYARPTCFYNVYSRYTGLVYMTLITSPYNVKFAYLFIPLAKTKIQTVSVLSTVARATTFRRTQTQLIATIPTLKKSAVKIRTQSLSASVSLLPKKISSLKTQPVSVLLTVSRVATFRRELTQPVSAILTVTRKIAGISAISRIKTGIALVAGRVASRQYRRTYLEWPITAIPSGSTITAVKLKYHGKAKPSTDTVSVYSMENQPSAQPDTDTGNETVYKDVEDGTAYISGSSVFPVVGANQELDLGADAVADLQAAVNAGRTWFAIGVKTSEQTIGDFAEIYSEEYEYADPKPTLVVTYTTLSAAPYKGVYLCRMAKTKGNFLRQTLVAKVPTDLVEKITFAGKSDTTPAQIEVLVHYDDYYSDTSTISLTTDWAVYAVKFSPGKNVDYITITYVGDTEAGKYLYFDEFTIDFHEIGVAGAVESYIQPFQEIDTTVTRDASGNITKVEMANATRKVTLEITRDAQGRIISITREVT
jgi:hypothetical protein